MIKIERIETKDGNSKTKEFENMAEALCYIQNKSGHVVKDIQAQLDKSRQFNTQACIFKIVK